MSLSLKRRSVLRVVQMAGPAAVLTLLLTIYLLKSHLKETFHSTFDGQKLGGESRVAYSDGSVLLLVGISV